MGNLRLIRLASHQASPLSVFCDRNIFQTSEWLKFISVTENAEQVIALVMDGELVVGRFTGLVVKKLGVRILGSPFPGWTTYYMGFNLNPSVSRTDALIALEKFAFIELKCLHIEIMDRHISTVHLKQAGFVFDLRERSGFEIDLTKSEGELLGKMSASCRHNIRKSIKNGVTIEIANDKLFAHDYYMQLKDVFAKQGLFPTYSIEKVRKLIEYVHPSGMLLLLRAKSIDGACIATGIFPAMNDTMYFWGGASWRAYQKMYPNEAIQWFAMRYWKEKGINRFNMGGGGEYKQKYGGYEIYIPWGRKSKYRVLGWLRNIGKKMLSDKPNLAHINKLLRK